MGTASTSMGTSVLSALSALSTLSALSALSALSSGVESSGTRSSCGSPAPGLEERSRVSLDSSEVAEVYDEAMEVSACDGRALRAHVGSAPSAIDAVTRCSSERSSSPVEREAVGCAVAAGVAASCEEPTALEPEVAPGVAPRAAGLPLSALAPWPRLRFRLRTSGVLTSEPVLVCVPPRAETSPPVSDCDGGGRGGATAAGGAMSKRPVGSLGGAEADEAAEDEATGGFFFLPFPCLDPARAAVGSCDGGGGTTDWRLESGCLCVRKGAR